MADGILYLNGAWCGAGEAKISVMDRGLLFADAVYEVVRAHKGRTFRVAEHCARMCNGLRELEIPAPFSPEEFVEICRGLIKRNAITSGSVYLQVTRGEEPQRAHRLPEHARPTMFGFARAVELPSWKSAHPKGVAAITMEDFRWHRCNIKTTMLLPNCLAKQQAIRAGAYEALLVGEDGLLREGSSTSVFAVLDGVLRAHPATPRVLPSITHSVVLELARRAAMKVDEKAVTAAEAARAEEMFLASTTLDVCPLTQLDGRPVGDGRIGPVTKRLIGLFAEFLDAECG